MLSGFRINQLAEMGFKTFVRALLIRSHQAGVPRHVGGKDRGKAANSRH
jgi:hypothetical protein